MNTHMYFSDYRPCMCTIRQVIFFFPIMYTYGSTIESYICARVGFPIDLAMPEVK
jgi:hypothetical protein